MRANENAASSRSVAGGMHQQRSGGAATSAAASVWRQAAGDITAWRKKKWRQRKAADSMAVAYQRLAAQRKQWRWLISAIKHQHRQRCALNSACRNGAHRRQRQRHQTAAS